MISVNAYGANTGIFRKNWNDNTATDALAPCVAKSFATKLLTLVEIDIQKLPHVEMT